MRPIQSTDPTGHFLLERWPRRARRAIPAGALIVVEDGEVAVLLDDRAAGPRVFPAGDHPIDEATGSALVVFLRPLPSEFLWGSAEPIQPVGSACGFRAHGTLRAAIADPGRAALALAEERALATQDEVAAFLRGLVVERLREALEGAPREASEAPQRWTDAMSARLATDLAECGLTLDALAILGLRPTGGAERRG
jgi:hypothetical protein